jgi:hypothetical protein
MLSNLDAIAGVAVIEQLGLALGIPGVVDVILPIVRRKTQDPLLLQQYLLEMASNAILPGKDFKKQYRQLTSKAVTSAGGCCRRET